MSRTRSFIAAAALVGAAVLAGCSGDLVHTYDTFRGAVKRGAPCAELFDQRARFDDPGTLARVDRDLDRIGCSSPEATRTDR